MRKVSIIKWCSFALLMISILALASLAREDVPAIDSIKMDNSGDYTKFLILKSGALEFQDFRLSNPDRVVLDFIGARHQLGEKTFDGDGVFVERIRTSQFMNTPDEISRVVFDLKRDSKYSVTVDGENVIVEFSPADGIEIPGKGEIMKSTLSPEEKAGETDQVPTSTPMPNRVEQQTSDPKPVEKQLTQPIQQLNMTKQQPESRPMRQELEAPAFPGAAGGYSGSAGMTSNKPITIDVQQASVNTVLQSIAEFSGVDILAGPEVTGEITAHLNNIPWRQALSIILKTHGFDYREEYGVIRVSTVENLMKEELEKQAAERKKDELLPLVTAIVPLQYSNAEEMKKALEKIVSSRGNIEVERGSNSLLVTDIQKNVDKIQEMVASLDDKIEQVEIVAKLVDVDIEATMEMGIRWDFLNLSPSNVNVTGDAVIDASAPAPVGKFRVGTVQSWGELKAVIDLLERDNKANIISNPRIITADNREASILVGKQIPLIVSDEAGNPITELTKIGIGLRVTPHINSDNTITMDLHPEISELSAQATVQGGVIISLSEADTRVIVGDGETAVIGGLINTVESKFENGVPWLKEIPGLGNLFKFKSKTTKKRELIIFITPRVVSSGLASHTE